MRAVDNRNILVLVVALAAMAAATAQAETPKAEIAPVVPDALAPNGMEVVWQTAALLPSDPPFQNLWLCGNLVVGCDKNNRIYAVNATTGVRQWSHQVAEPFQKVWRPAAAKDSIWVATTTTLWGFTAMDGNVIQNQMLDFSPAGSVATNGAQVFIPDVKGWLQAVVAGPPFTEWSRWAGGPVTAAGVMSDKIIEVQRDEAEPAANNVQVHGADANGTKGVSWGRWTEDNMTAGPVIDNAAVYFAGQNGVIYASQQNVRHVLWEYKTEGPIVGDLQLTKNGLLLVPSLDYTVYAFHGASGRIAWRFNAGEPIRRTPYTSGSQVFVFAREAGLTAMDVASGRSQWTFQPGQDFVAADRDSVYVVNRSGELVALNRVDGKVRFTLAMQPGTLWAYNQGESGILYLATPSGQMMALARKTEPGDAKKTETPQAKKPAAVTAAPTTAP